MILFLVAKLFFFYGEGIEIYQIPQKDSTTFYFVYRLEPDVFPLELAGRKRVRCVSVYTEVKYKNDIIGAFWDKDTILEDSETYSAIKHIRVKRHRKYYIKTTVSTCHLLKRYEKEKKEKDLYPLSSLIPSIRDSIVQFAWYFDTIGYISVYSLISDSGSLSVQKEYGGHPLKNKKIFLKKGWNFIPIHLKGFAPNTYRFTLRVKKYKREVFIPILNGEGWSKKDWRIMIMAVRYIFTPEELDSLDSAPLNEKKKLWDEYWTRRDPTPMTPKNEVYMEFLNRLRYANEHFRSIFKNTLSDMAIIYITLGEPDEEERHEFEQNSPPYIIWYYYKYNLRFLFVDRFNTGDFELVDPPQYKLREIMDSIRK